MKIILMRFMAEISPKRSKNAVDQQRLYSPKYQGLRQSVHRFSRQRPCHFAPLYLRFEPSGARNLLKSPHNGAKNQGRAASSVRGGKQWI